MRSYGEVAVACGNRKAARAVGQAVHRNPLPIIIPCHRVVGASNLGGYAGGVSIKRFLLWLEGVYKEKERFFR
jgi:methylated-DNA-[protein]-cysteine S-methyltransferase